MCVIYKEVQYPIQIILDKRLFDEGVGRRQTVKANIYWHGFVACLKIFLWLQWNSSIRMWSFFLLKGHKVMA